MPPDDEHPVQFFDGPGMPRLPTNLDVSPPPLTEPTKTYVVYRPVPFPFSIFFSNNIYHTDPNDLPSIGPPTEAQVMYNRLLSKLTPLLTGIFRSQRFLAKCAAPVFDHPKLSMILLITGKLVWILNRRRIKDYLRYKFSTLVDRTKYSATDPRVYKSAFSRIVLPDIAPILDNHSHPYSAAARNISSRTAHTFAVAVGLTPYYVQMSTADQNRSYHGSRNYYWYKDVNVRPSPHQPTDEHLQIIVDTDHYMDMPHHLAWQTNPVLISTFQPHAVAMGGHSKCNFSFTFDTNNVVDYVLAGSARYNHMVWNYNKETITCFRKFWIIPYCCTSYLVERITTEPHHELVLLSPLGSWTWLTPIMYWLYGENELERLKVNQGSHNRLLVKTTTGLLISTGIPSTFTCATISAELDTTIAAKAAMSKSGLSNAGIATMLPGDPADLEVQSTNTTMAVILNDYHTKNPLAPPPTLVAPNPREYKRYQYGPVQNDDAKPTLYAYMQPIVDGAYGPDKTAPNEQRAVEMRINRPKNDTRLTPFLANCISEFLEMLVPVPHRRHPTEFENLPDHFTKSVQQLQYNAVNDGGADWFRRIKSFIKAEAYAKPAAPRIISTINDYDKMHYSCYQYSIAMFLKTIPSYAFGKTPQEVSEHIALMATHAATMTEGDFSTFDGTIGETLRILEQAFALRLFDRKYHTHLDFLLRTQKDLIGTLPLGTKYHQDDGRASGSPETSNFNTLDNMFVNYVARRTLRDDPKVAFHKVTHSSIFGGDDSLAADLPPDALIKACKFIGLIVKVKTIPRNQGGMTFLSRVYTPGVWNGDVNNCGDILRILKKMHVSHIRPQSVTDKQYLVDKMFGYVLSDGSTPYVGAFAKKTIEFFERDKHTPDNPSKIDTTSIGYLASWAMETGSQFPNAPCDYFTEYAKDSMPTFNEDKFFQHLDTCASLDDMLKFPLCLEIEKVELPVDATVHVNGETVATDPKPRKKGNRNRHARVRTSKYREFKKQYQQGNSG